MNESLSNKEEEVGNNGVVDKLIPIFIDKVCSYFNIGVDNAAILESNFITKSKLSGHNNQICLIDFYNSEKRHVGEVCLKYSANKEKYLQIEFEILSLLYSNNISCPRVIDSGFQNNFSYLLMEVVKGDCLSDKMIDIQIAESVLNAIYKHEMILLNNVQTLQQSELLSDLDKEIDFKNKLINFLQKFTPNFTVKNSLDFLNSHLNHPDIITKRKIITDRSAENVFIDENNQVIMIDFSTVRVGTQFDNWIQFTDCPTTEFSCTKKELIDLFFGKNNLQEKEKDSYYVSAIYTNLLQGIFTHKKDRQLSMRYINNVNDYFQKFTKEKGVLIEIIH